MSLRDKISQAQTKALKERDSFNLSVLRMLWSAVRNAEIDKKSELSDEEIQEVVVKQVKQLKDASNDFQKAGRKDLFEKNQREMELLEKYLPEKLSDSELEEIIKVKAKALNVSSPADMGKLMGAVMSEVKGRVDGNQVRGLVMKILS